MLAKSSTTPQGRMLSLFDILGDWLQAPSMQLDIQNNNTANQQLIAFCTAQAKACGAQNPAILAEHIVLIARNAAQQEINQPGCNSLAHAKKAAHALILAQTHKESFFSEVSISKHAAYSIAASIFILIGAAALWLPNLMQYNHSQTAIASHNTASTKALAAKPTLPSAAITAHDAAAMYAKFEQMRNGTCQFPEAIQIPDKDKAIYLENVVGGKLPTNLANLAVANAYLEKVRCNFTPMLMAHSK